MKTYNETINTVFERIEQYNSVQKRKRKIITRVAVPAFSMCLAVVVSIFAFKDDIFKSKAPVTREESTGIGEKDDVSSGEIDGDWYGEGQESPPENISGNSSTSSEQVSDSAKLLCVINQIESIQNSDIAPPHPVDEHYNKQWNNDEAIEYLNIDFSLVNEKYNLDASNCGAWYKKSDDKIVMDYNAFDYSNDKASFCLEASKTFVPGDCIVVSCEEVVSTIIGTKNGPVYVMFYGTTGTVISQNYSDKQATMIAEFEHKGVYFRVKSNDVSAFSFYQFVSAVANG